MDTDVNYIVTNIKILDKLYGHRNGQRAYVTTTNEVWISDDTQTLYPMYWRKLDGE